MGIETLLKAFASSTQAGPAAEPGAVALPASQANPSDVKAFNDAMAKDTVKPAGIDGPDGFFRGQAQAVPKGIDPDSMKTLGDRMKAREAMADNSPTREWINTAVDVVQNGTIAFPDLYRVQVLASMAKIEATRNSSINKSMDDTLRTLLKNT